MMFYIYRDEDGYWRWRLMIARMPKGIDQMDDCRADIQLVKNCGIAF